MMKKYLKAIVNLIIAEAGFFLIIFLVPRLLFFFAPFVAGWMIAWIASPMVRFFEEKLRIKRKAGSAFVITAVIGTVAFALYLAGARLAVEIAGLLESLPGIWEGMVREFGRAADKLNGIYGRLPEDAQSSIRDAISQVGADVGALLKTFSAPAINVVGNVAMQIPSILIAVIIALLSAYFFVSDRSVINEWFRGHTPVPFQKRYRIVRSSMVNAVGGYLKAQLRIEVWMYLLLVVGFVLLRVDYAMLIALGIAFLDFLPFFGTGTVMVPWAIVKILNADYRMALWLLIIWGLGQLARQILQPKIVGDSLGMPPLPTLFLLYAGYKLGGVGGMIAAVPIGLVVLELYRGGAFDTTKDSLRILINGLNRFRELSPKDLEE